MSGVDYPPKDVSVSKRSWLHPILGIAGLGAWLLFILGCMGWPSWSPDGTRILAPYFDPGAQQAGIALYDLRTRTARPMFVRPAVTEDEIIPAQWESDGQRAILLTSTPDPFSVLVTLLPVDSSRPARHFILVRDDMSMLPFPQLGNVLYVGGKRLSALNLETGEQADRPLENDQEVQLSTDGSRILYAREPEDGHYEFGTVSPGDLSLHPLFKVTSAELRARGFSHGDLSFSVAPDPHGSRFAVRLRGETRDAVALFTSAGLERLLQPEFGVPGARIGIPQWAPGGKLLYLPVAAETAPGQGQYWLAEVPLDAGQVRMTKIARFEAVSNWDARIIAAPFSLSPDGATLATTTAAFSPEMLPAEFPRALYLVDLGDPGRAVTSIPAPLAPVPGAAKETK